MDNVSKQREAGVESKFVKSLLYGMALKLKAKDIENIVLAGSSRVDEMSEGDIEKLQRQVPKAVKLLGAREVDDFGVLDSDKEALNMSSEISKLIDNVYLPSIKEKAPKFFLRKVGDYIVVLTGQFHTGSGEYSLNGSVDGGRNISSTKPDKMLCQADGSKFNVVRELKDYGVYESLIIWGWALKLEDGVNCRFWVNKRGGSGDLAKLRAVLKKNSPRGFELA